ncbi:ATP-binding protein [Gloeocapsa sp. PCC 73106]|uniref:ATP-binding protein n=1 Tax=Gloeocapsa sp. PCC 73106 TaxID=102232 RepID=UPI0002AC7379|nr:ATP-binding protein [Gloeocapsa sp. PCC 73106]ELR97548.1 anti-sigma regulatory factor (Ser/Thr protein kinase) [Gloeocapsa sp. PCC 73106]
MNSLTISGELDSLDNIYQYIVGVSRAANLDKKAAYKLRLAVDEIVTNIVIYGYQDAGKKGDLYLSWELNEKTLTVAVEDTAIPFDPTVQGIPDSLDKCLELRNLGGLGIYLAIQGVDKFIYERIGDRNRNILIVNR